MAVDGEVAFLEAATEQQAADIQAILSTQWDYVHGWIPASRLHHLPAAIAGRRVVKDPRELDDLARRGEFDIDSLYRELFE